MSEPAKIERITRSLAYMLRHQPDKFDLEIDPYGFATMAETVRALSERLGDPVSEEDVHAAVSAGDRPRYEIQGDRIRALYGHSIPVEPGPAAKPPETLYVALPTDDVERAQRFGLRGGRRRFLHLTLSEEEARDAGRRVAKNYTVLSIRALDAWEEGHSFYDRQSLWLAESIPTHLIEVEERYDDGVDPERREHRPPRGGRRERRGGDEPRDGRRRGGRRDGGRSGGGRSEGGRSEGGRSEGGRSEGGRREGGGRDAGGRDSGRGGSRDRDRAYSGASASGRSGSEGDRGRSRDSRRDRPESRSSDRSRPRQDSAPVAREENARPEPAAPAPRPSSRPAKKASKGRPFGAGVVADETPVTPTPPPKPEPKPAAPEPPPAKKPEPSDHSTGFGAGL